MYAGNTTRGVYFRVYRCVIIALKLCRTHALFNCDEACLERKDPTYRASVDSDGKQIDADTVKDVLNFVDATMEEGTEMAEVAPEMKEGLPVEVGMETEAKEGDPLVQMVRELNRVGHGIREQSKLITDLTYELESLDCGQYVLEELTGLYQYLYKNGQEHRKEHLRHRPLFKSKHKQGFFCRRCIVPLYPTKSWKVRQAKASRFSRRSGQEAKEVSATDSDENMEIVEETEKLAKESLFIDLEAYKGQDDRQAKSLGTPGLFTPSHYVLAHGKVTLDANFGICVC